MECCGSSPPTSRFWMIADTERILKNLQCLHQTNDFLAGGQHMAAAHNGRLAAWGADQFGLPAVPQPRQPQLPRSHSVSREPHPLPSLSFRGAVCAESSAFRHGPESRCRSSRACHRRLENALPRLLSIFCQDKWLDGRKMRTGKEQNERCDHTLYGESSPIASIHVALVAQICM